MRKLILLLLISACLLVVFAACEKNPAKEYGRGLTQSLDKANTAAAAMNLDALKKSVSAYHALNDRYPDSLDELAGQMGLDPEDFTYDPETGKVGIRQF